MYQRKLRKLKWEKMMIFKKIRRTIVISIVSVITAVLFSTPVLAASTYTVDTSIVPNCTHGTGIIPRGVITYSSDEAAIYKLVGYNGFADVHVDGRLVAGVQQADGTFAYTFPKGTTGRHVLTGSDNDAKIRDYYVNLDGFTWQQRKDSVAVGVGYKTADSSPEFRFQAYNLQTKSWEVISDWSTSNWIDWKGTVGDYWLHCEMRSADKLAMTSKTMAFRYTAGQSKLTGTYSGWRNGEVLLGATTAQSNTRLQFKLYNLDTKQWFYLTDDTNRANWVSYQPSKGNYWVHFESRTDDGRLADTITYCFAVK